MNDIQQKLHDVHSYEANHYTYPSTNKVFLTELSQFQDTDEERKATLRSDLAGFLGLKHTFDQEAPHFVPGMKWSAESQAIRDSRKIDICEEQYRPLREELMKGSRETSVWIRTFFLASKEVYISSPEYFDQIMRDWMNDPCEDESQTDQRAVSKWPRLGTLIDDDGKIISDVQFLLDFAIIGVEKCGTSAHSCYDSMRSPRSFCSCSMSSSHRYLYVDGLAGVSSRDSMPTRRKLQSNAHDTGTTSSRYVCPGTL